MLLLRLLLHEGHFPSRWWWKYFPHLLPSRAQLDYKKRSEKITMSMQVHRELFNLTMDDTPTSNHPQWDGGGAVVVQKSHFTPWQAKWQKGCGRRQELWVSEWMNELRWEQGCCYYWTQVSLYRRTWDMVYWFTTTTGSCTISSALVVVGRPRRRLLVYCPEGV